MDDTQNVQQNVQQNIRNINVHDIERFVAEYQYLYPDRRRLDVIEYNETVKAEDTMLESVRGLVQVPHMSMLAEVYIDNDVLKIRPIMYGRGQSGVVIGICQNHRCDHVAKIIKLRPNDEQSIAAATAEYEYARIAGCLKVGPQIHDAFTLNHRYMFILMDRIKYTLKHNIEVQNNRTFTAHLQRLVYVLVYKLWHDGNGLVHMDLHLDNIALNLADNQLVLIDFGSMRRLRVPLYSLFILVDSIFQRDPQIGVDETGVAYKAYLLYKNIYDECYGNVAYVDDRIARMNIDIEHF